MNIDLQGNKISIEKKYIIIGCLILLGIFLLLMIPKSKNKLECTMQNSNNTGIFSRTYVATFKNNKLDNLVFELKNTPTERFIDMLDSIYNNYNSQLKDLKNAGGYEYKIEKDNNHIYYKATIKLNEIPKSTEDIIHYTKNWNYKDLKKDLENIGYTCK